MSRSATAARPGPPVSLAVVVLSVGAPPDLRGAVRSLITQRPAPAEIIVVNSGGGDARERVRHLLPPEAVVEAPGLLLHGATRNAGIAATRAGHVAFLSADCRARPGWVAGRVAAHRAGHVAVAGAVTNRSPRNTFASASQMLLYSRRMPGTRPDEVLRYGVSYDRALFGRFGGFDESLDGGEDTEFHERLARAGVAIHWAPTVVGEHPHPTSLAALLADQYRRGRRMTRYQVAHGMRRRTVLRNVGGRTGADLARAWRSAPVYERPRMAVALPVTPLAAGAYLLGCLGSGRPEPTP